ncbi:MAG TPA: ATP-grasp domain-containing protein [Verrucomicrobiae bacterium]|nr:ATP-grasp domain-containing protein [Verrucomicrobiae bacterium]
MAWLENAISYNRNRQMGSVYYDQSYFIYLNQYFDDYLMVGNSHNQWLKDFDLYDKHIQLQSDGEAHTNPRLAASESFAEVVKSHPRRKFVLYGPLDPPYPVNPLMYIMNSPTIAHAYEHKRYFRDEFADLINLPDHVVKRLDELNADAYAELSAMFGEKFVVQEVESSGSKGTFIVKNLTQFEAAVRNLKAISYSGTVVVSKFIDGETFSVQVCVTKYGIFTGGLQRQLVDSPYLCNPNLPEVTKWVGGELGGQYPEILKHRTQEIATVVGSELASHGYRGIFGIDLIITPENEVYAIEINARLTGYSGVLSDMQFEKQKIPFMLLHILELANMRYEVNDSDALPTMNSLDDKYSYLILCNQLETKQILKTEIKSGIYKLTEQGVEFVKSSYSIVDLPDEDHVIILSRFKKGDTINRGSRILKIIKKGATMSAETADLDKPAQELVAKIKQHFKIES